MIAFWALCEILGTFGHFGQFCAKICTTVSWGLVTGCQICSEKKFVLFFKVSFPVNNTIHSAEIRAVQCGKICTTMWSPSSVGVLSLVAKYALRKSLCWKKGIQRLFHESNTHRVIFFCQQHNMFCRDTWKNMHENVEPGRRCLVTGCQICCAIRFTASYSRVSCVIR